MTTTTCAIDDHDLRESYGELIGDIASSHHWDLEMVESRFKIPRPAAPFLGADWVVDSLKVACLLRVADAGHMDGARAPSFLLRVLQIELPFENALDSAEQTWATYSQTR